MPNAKYDHVFVVLRYDGFHDPETPPMVTVSVVKIVRTRERAEEEAARLNRSKPDESIIYYWQIGRMERAASE